MNAYDIILRPVMTEKTAGLMSDGDKIVFRVRKQANKNQIRAAVESLFGVNVVKVNTMTMPGRARRFGKYTGHKAGFKKAVVTLEEGQSLDLFAMEDSGEGESVV